MASDPTEPIDEAENRSVDEAVAEYLLAQDRGQPIPDEEWLSRYPDLRPRLVRFLAGQAIAADLFAPSADRGATSVPERLHYFGDFELVGVLGQGGMGVVYLAHQISLRRPVALKMIRSGHLADEEEIRRFRNEAEAVARLDHPNLLTIFEVGEHAGQRYFTMPLVGGGSLADGTARYSDDPSLAARILIDVADGIDHAHRRGILHRDLKPANILIDETDRPLVSDFGLSKRINGDETTTTAVSALLGTPAYMAPEQATRRPGAVTTACDIYGLGAILFALLTGRPPFASGTLIEVLHRVCNDPPEDPSKLNRRVDRRLSAICLRCLEKDPRRRYPSAGALADDLRRWLRGEPVRARPASPLSRLFLWCRRHPIPAALATLLGASLVIGSGGIVWQWREAAHQREISAIVDRYFRVAFLGFDDALSFVGGASSIDERDLDYADQKIGSRFREIPEAEAGIREALGIAYRGIGRPLKARGQFERSLELLERADRPDGNSLLLLRREYISVCISLEDSSQGTEQARVVADETRARFGPKGRASTLARSTLAQASLAAGQWRVAEDIDHALLDDLDPRDAIDDQIAIMVRCDLSLALKSGGQSAESEEQIRTCLKRVDDAKLPGTHPLVLTARNILVGLLIETNRFDEARQVLQATLGEIPDARQADRIEGLAVLHNRAALRFKLREHGDAEADSSRAVAGLGRVLPAGHSLLLNARSLLADCLYMRGDWGGVVSEYDRIARDRPPGSVPGPSLEAVQGAQFAEALVEVGQADRAVALLEPVAGRLRGRVDAVPPSSRTSPAAVTDRRLLGQVLTTLGMAQLARGSFARARTALEDARVVRSEALLNCSWRLANTESLLGEAHLGLADLARAEELLVASSRALEGWSPRPPERLIKKAQQRVARYQQARATADHPSGDR